MVERNAFFKNSKHQYLLSQCGEYDRSAHNKKNGDYNEDQSLSHVMDEFNYTKNGGKKSFSCQTKASSRASQRDEKDCSAFNKKRRRLLSVSNFYHCMDKL